MNTTTLQHLEAVLRQTARRSVQSLPLICSSPPLQDIMNEIQAIIRQITASVTFLPLLQVAFCRHAISISSTSCLAFSPADLLCVLTELPSISECLQRAGTCAQDACTFDLLVYTDNNVDVPQTWEESDPKYINNQQVRS